MRGVCNLEAYGHVRFQLFLGELDDLVGVLGQRALLVQERWVWEVDVGLSIREWTLDECHSHVGGSAQERLTYLVLGQAIAWLGSETVGYNLVYSKVDTVLLLLMAIVLVFIRLLCRLIHGRLGFFLLPDYVLLFHELALTLAHLGCVLTLLCQTALLCFNLVKSGCGGHFRLAVIDHASDHSWRLQLG